MRVVATQPANRMSITSFLDGLEASLNNVVMDRLLIGLVGLVLYVAAALALS